MTMKHSVVWGILGALAIGSYGTTAAAQCASDTDCDVISTCEQDSYTETCDWVADLCGDDALCVTSMGCTPYTQEWTYCQRRQCEADADCGEGFLCDVQTSTECSVEVCAGEECPQGGEEPVCNGVTAGECRFRFERSSCTADADCGEGFTCIQGESTYDVCDDDESGAAGGSGVASAGGPSVDPVVVTGVGGGAGIPSTGTTTAAGGTDAVGMPGGCHTETHSYSYCQLNEVPCSDDSDCADDLFCDINDSADCYIATTGAVVCNNPAVAERVCKPVSWGTRQLMSQEEYEATNGVYDAETGCRTYSGGDRWCPEAYYYADGTYYSYEDYTYYNADGTPMDIPEEVDIIEGGIDDDAYTGAGGSVGLAGSAGMGSGSSATGDGSGGTCATSTDPADGESDADAPSGDSGSADPTDDAATEEVEPGDDGHGHHWGWGKWGMGSELGCTVSSPAPSQSPAFALGGLIAASLLFRRRRNDR